MLVVNRIYNIGEHIAFDFSNGECGVFHKFGSKGDIYTTVTDKLNKKTLETIKQDIKKVDWDVEQLKEIYLC